jgi:hypothetical protein
VHVPAENGRGDKTDLAMESLQEPHGSGAGQPAAPESQRSAAFENPRLIQSGNARDSLTKLTSSATPSAIRHRKAAAFQSTQQSYTPILTC